METKTDFEDKLVIEGINSEGYGIMPKMIMQDKRLTIESKAIYAYLVSYAGAGTSAFPGLKKILSDLCISENRFYKHRKLLIDYGYISVKAIRNEKKVIIKNIYTLQSNPEKKENVTEEGVPSKMKDRVPFKMKEGVSHKIEDRGIPQNEGGRILTDFKINKLKLTSKKDDDEINKQTIKKDFSEIIRDSKELKELTQQLIESDVPLEVTEDIIHHFYDTNLPVKLKVVRQQLEWMLEKSNQEIGISSFTSYFIFGYEERLNNGDIVVAKNFESEEEALPKIPMYNWLSSE